MAHIRFVPALLVMFVIAFMTRGAHAQEASRAATALTPSAYTVGTAKADALLVVHYHRADGNYRDWNLWCWPEGGEGREHAFDGRDAFGRYAIVPLLRASMKVPQRAGFLVRKGNWEAKDFDQDRFVALADQAVTEIWLQQGVEAWSPTPSTIETGLVVAGAFLDSFDRITLTVNTDLTARQLKAIRVVDRRDSTREFSVKRITGSFTHEITLRDEVAASDVAQLQLKFDRRESVFEGLAAVTVFARNVLENEAFSALDETFGALCTEKTTRCVTWSPVSDAVELLLYEGADLRIASRVIPLTREARGVWRTTLAGDLHGVPYRYRFHNYSTTHDVADMWAYAATADSTRTIFVDLDRVKPANFDTVEPPRITRATDEVIYEVHVRDFSINDSTADTRIHGTYLGLTHEATAQSHRVSSGLDHLQELGITAIHLLPVQDFTAKTDEYNWGYWTTLFNVPESNYATDPTKPFSAITDLRDAITRLHAAKIRVLMDVVYNHTSSASLDSPFAAPAPYYFFRTTAAGRLTNDSGTGNSFADERPMARKYIIDSLAFWLTSYKVDGFRFDLLGTHHPDTVAAICARVKSIRPDATLYGEPWTGGGPTHFGKGAQKGMPIAVFNDHLRNAIRGDLDGNAIGFATGAGGDDAAIRRGVAGSIDDFTREPTESINYADAHDNLALWDKLEKTQPTATDATKRMMQKLALGIVLTSQGIPFLHGGSEFARTKLGQHNTYNAGDTVNQFDWTRKKEYANVFAFTAGLVKLRREHPAFRMSDDADVRKALAFMDTGRTVAFTLDGSISNDAWSRIFVAYNDEPTALTLELPSGEWEIVVNDSLAGTETISRATASLTLQPYSMIVAHSR